MLVAATSIEHDSLQWRVGRDGSLSALDYYAHPDYAITQLAQLSEQQLRELALEGIRPARFELALRLIARRQYRVAALHWRPQLNSLNEKSIQRLSRVLAEHKQWATLDELSRVGYSLDADIASRLAIETKRSPLQVSPEFAARNGFLLHPGLASANAECVSNVMLLSDHAAGIETLMDFSERFANNPEPAENVICLSKPVYLGDFLQCGSDTLGRASCNWKAGLAKLENAFPAGFDHLVMMTEEGTANVRGGIMQLTSAQDYGVFLHELMHFSGFEDEYPLPMARRNRLCREGGRIAPNLFIDGEKRLTPPAGWQQADSCNNTEFQAYKPAAHWSIMEYDSQPLDGVYRTLWRRQLDDSAPLVRFADYFYYLTNSPHWLDYAGLQAEQVRHHVHAG